MKTRVNRTDREKVGRPNKGVLLDTASLKDNNQNLPTAVNRTGKTGNHGCIQVRLPFRSTYFLSGEVVGGQQSSYETDVDLEHGHLSVLEKTDKSSFMYVGEGRPGSSPPSSSSFFINIQQMRTGREEQEDVGIRRSGNVLRQMLIRSIEAAFMENMGP